MATLNRLTARQVATAGDGWHADGGNLYLRVDGDGHRRRWIYRFTRNSRVTEIGLGAAGAVSLKYVREERAKITEAITRGEDPRAERRRAEHRRKTFAEVARFVIDRDREHWGAASLDQWQYSLNVQARRLSSIAVADVGVEDVKQTVMPIYEKGNHISARRTLTRIEAVLDCAIAHGWRSADNAAAWKVFKHIAPKRPKADRRHPMVPWREAPAAFAKMWATDTTTARCLEFIALTAVRLTEARGAKWSEIDFEAETWRIPAERMKMRDAHVVPLSRLALDLLSELKAHETGPFVFPGRNLRQHVSKTGTWEQAKKLTDSASIHGWRSTFRSWCADNGVDREVAESALAHSIGGVEGAYNRARMVERRRPVMQAWGAFLAGENVATVIPFSSKQP